MSGLPLTHLLGEANKGFYKFWNSSMRAELRSLPRLSASVRELLIGALDYAKQRGQFGKKLVDFQITQHKLADMATKLEMARLLTYKAAWNYDLKRIDPKLTSMAKMFAGRTSRGGGG